MTAAITPSQRVMRYDATQEIVYGSPADTVYLLMAPDRGATLIGETETAWTWFGGGVVQIVPKGCYVQLDAEQIIALENDSSYPLGGVPDGDVLYMKIDEFNAWSNCHRPQLTGRADRRLLR